MAAAPVPFPPPGLTNGNNVPLPAAPAIPPTAADVHRMHRFRQALENQIGRGLNNVNTLNDFADVVIIDNYLSQILDAAMGAPVVPPPAAVGGGPGAGVAAQLAVLVNQGINTQQQLANLTNDVANLTNNLATLNNKVDNLQNKTYNTNSRVRGGANNPSPLLPIRNAAGALPPPRANGQPSWTSVDEVNNGSSASINVALAHYGIPVVGNLSSRRNALLYFLAP